MSTFLPGRRSLFIHREEGGEGSATTVQKNLHGSDNSVFLEGLMPKQEIGALQILEEHPNYDGQYKVKALKGIG